MLRSALTLALVVAFPTFADEDEVPAPSPSYAAEGTQVKLEVRAGHGFDYAEVTFKVTRCLAGPCAAHETVKVLAPLSSWQGKHGQTMGLLRYAWRGKKGEPRAWALAMRLDDADESDQFLRHSDEAIRNVGESPGDSAVATR